MFVNILKVKVSYIAKCKKGEKIVYIFSGSDWKVIWSER